MIDIVVKKAGYYVLDFEKQIVTRYDIPPMGDWVWVPDVPAQITGGSFDDVRVTRLAEVPQQECVCQELLKGHNQGCGYASL